MARETEPTLAGFRPSELRSIYTTAPARADRIYATFLAQSDPECQMLHASLCYQAHRAMGKPDAPITPEQKNRALDDFIPERAVDKQAARQVEWYASELIRRGWFPMEQLVGPPDDAA